MLADVSNKGVNDAGAFFSLSGRCLGNQKKGRSGVVDLPQGFVVKCMHVVLILAVVVRVDIIIRVG